MEEEILGKAYDARLMRRLTGYLLPYRREVSGALALLLVHASLQAVGPLLTKYAVDHYLLPAAQGARRPADAATGLALLSAAYFAVIALSLAAEYAQTLLMQRTGQRAMFDLRRDLFAHLQRLHLAYFDRHPVGRLVTRVTSDVDTLNEMYSSGVVAMIGDVVMLSLVLATMWMLSPPLTLILLAAIPFVLLTGSLFQRAVRKSYREIRLALARLNAYLRESLNGIAVVQLFRHEDAARARFDQSNREHRDAYRDSVHAYGWFYPVVDFWGMAAIAALLAYGGYRVEAGALSLGSLLAFLQYGLRFFRPISDLSEKYNILQSAMAAAERIFKLLDATPDIAAPAAPRPIPTTVPAIEFEHVWFAYQHEDWVLRDVSFRVEPNQTVALVGHTGAGKTTVTSLLLRFYDIQRGRILVDGVDIREYDPRELRSLFGVVLQDPFLFTGTVAQNIALRGDYPEDEIQAAAAQVNLIDKPLDSPVGERGQGLSTGQKQLIGFARALIRRPLCLILDEATSSVDTEAELRIQEALARIISGRSSLVVAHRLSTIQRADRILVFHKGSLRESGTHQELLAARGIYHKLYQLQYASQELPSATGDAHRAPASATPEPSPASAH